MKYGILKYGNDTVNTLKFGDAVVNKLVTPEGDYWEPGEPVLPSYTFTPSIYGIDTQGRFFIDRKYTGLDSYGDTLNPSDRDATEDIYLSTPSSIMFRIDGENYGDLLMDHYWSIGNYGFISSMTDGTWKWASIDNKYVVFSRALDSQFYCGGVSGNSFSAVMGFFSSNKPNSRLDSDGYFYEALRNNSYVNGNLSDYYIRFKSTLDEYHTLLTRPYYITKITRMPSSGYSNGSTYFNSYPYTFDSNLYIDSPSFFLLRRGEDGLIYNEITQTNASYDGFTVRYRKVNQLDYNIVYSISTNTTPNFKEWSILAVNCESVKNSILASLSYDSKVETKEYNITAKFGELYPCSMTHFIQEPVAKNRVYYGLSLQYKYPGFDDSNDLSSFNTFFETCSSKIISGSSDSITQEIRNTSGDSEYFAYPTDFDYNVDLSELRSSYTTISDDYSWGGKTYCILRFGNVSNDAYLTHQIIRFNRK